MADNSLIVTIGADVTSLQAKSAIAKEELRGLNADVKNLASQFVTASDEMKGSLAPQLEQAAQKAQKAKAELAALNAEMRESVHPEVTGFFQKLHENVKITGDSIESLHARLSVFSNAFGAFSELVVAALAIEQVGEAIKHTAEEGEQLGQLAEKTGVAVQTLSGLRVIALETNVGMEGLSGGLTKLARNMQTSIVTPTSTAAGAFNAMGLSARDLATGQMLPLDTVLGQVAAKFASYKDGPEKAALAQDLFGKSGADLIPLLNKLGEEGLAGATQKAKDLGVSFDETATQISTNFIEASKDAGQRVDGLKNQFSLGLMPALTVIEQGFTQTAAGESALSAVTTVLTDAFKLLVDVGTQIGVTIAEIIDVAVALVEELGSIAKGAEAVGEALSGNFVAAGRDISAAAHEIDTNWQSAITNIMANEKLARDTHDALWFGLKTNVPGADDGNKPKVAAPVLKPTVSGDGGVLKAAKDKLAAENLQIEQSATNTKQANAEKLANTVSYWQGVIAAGNLSAKDELIAREELTKAEMAQRQNELSSETSAAKSAATQQTTIARDAAAARKQIQAANYQSQLDLWGAEVAQGKITKAQELQDEIALKNAMFAVALAEAQKEAALTPAGSTAKAKDLDDIAVITAQHNQEIAKLNEDLTTQQIADAKKVADANKQAADQTLKNWQAAFAPLSAAFSSSISGIIQGTETLQQAEAKAAQSILLSFIDAEEKKLVNFLATEGVIVARALIGEQLQTAATVAGVTARTAAKTGADAAGKAADAISTTATINKSASQAAAGAYAAVAGIPIVGPVLAPVAAATAYAGVLAFDVLSAEGGMMIPSGVNPLTQLHENEMVLPAYLAQPMQQMIQGGGGGSTNTNHFNISQTLNGGGRDLSAIGDLMSSSNDALMKSLVDLTRNGSLRLPGR